MSYLISATWCTYRSIYIPVHSQYWYQHAVLNLITTRREITLLQYSTTLSSIIASFCIIFDFCYWWTKSTIYIPEYYQYWFQHAVINLITTRREFTLSQLSKTLSSIITSFCIIFNICYMMNQQYYIYCRILQVWFQHAVLNLITIRREFTLLQYSTTFSSIIASFCITFDNCYMMNQKYIYIPDNSQYWYQHAVLNLITTKRELTVLQCSTALSSVIASFCIIFDICYMMNQQYYIYLVYSQYWFKMLYWN